MDSILDYFPDLDKGNAIVYMETCIKNLFKFDNIMVS